MIAVGIVGGVFAGVVGAVTEIGVGPDVFGEILPELVAVPVAGAGLIGASAVFGLVVTGWFVVLLAGFVKALLPAGLMQLAATGRIRPALGWVNSLRRIRVHPGTYILLLLILVLFGILVNALPCRSSWWAWCPASSGVSRLPAPRSARPAASWASRWKPRRTDRRYRRTA